MWLLDAGETLRPAVCTGSFVAPVLGRTPVERDRAVFVGVDKLTSSRVSDLGTIVTRRVASWLSSNVELRTALPGLFFNGEPVICPLLLSGLCSIVDGTLLLGFLSGESGRRHFVVVASFADWRSSRGRVCVLVRVATSLGIPGGGASLLLVLSSRSRETNSRSGPVVGLFVLALRIGEPRLRFPGDFEVSLESGAIASVDIVRFLLAGDAMARGTRRAGLPAVVLEEIFSGTLLTGICLACFCVADRRFVSTCDG